MDTLQVGQERKHKPKDRLEVLLHEYSAFQTRYQHLWNMRLRWVAGIVTIVAYGLAWGLYYKFYVFLAVLPLAMTLELLLRQDGLYLKHIENKVNRVAGLELLQYYIKYSRVLGGMGYESGGMIPKSFMSILYFFFLPLFLFLWILVIKLAMTEYITPTFNTWIEVLVLVFYIGLLVASVVLLPLGFRKINNRFDFINKQDKIWYTNSETEDRD